MNEGTWLLLRGLTREAGHWGSFLPILRERAGRAAVATLDLPGAGTRWRERSPATITAITDDCRARAGAFERPWRLIGLSMGGMLAIDWAARHPDELAGALLINTSVPPFAAFHQRLRPALWPALARVLIGGDAAAVEATILRCTSAWPDRHAAVLADWVALRRQHPVSRANALRQLLAAARFEAPAARPAVAMQVICAQGDRLVDPACSSALAQAWSLPLAVHLHAGHDLPLDDPHWVAEQALALVGDGGR